MNSAINLLTLKHLAAAVDYRIHDDAGYLVFVRFKQFRRIWNDRDLNNLYEIFRAIEPAM